MTGFTTSDLNNAIENGSFVEEFNVSSYIGDTGNIVSELTLNDIIPPDIIDDSQQEQFLWNSGETVNFELSLKDNSLTYKVGDRILMSENVLDSDFGINGMLLGANSIDNGSVSLSNLRFEDGSRDMNGLLSEGSTMDFLKITGINDNFTLKGTQVFTWDETAPRPENLDLGYQIRVGNFQDIQQANNNQREIPEPSSISVFALAAIAMGIKAGKK